MPELPEVETVKETLRRQVLNKEISAIDIRYDKLLRNLDASSFKKKLLGKRFRDIGRYGKYLFFYLEDVVLIVHLRMEGKFFLKQDTEPIVKHEHVVFFFNDHSTLRYHDVRKFGTMEIVALGEEMNSQGVSKLGKEPFDSDFTESYIYDKIYKSARPIKSLLLDQEIIAGLGNIYVDEVLFLSGIDPRRQGKEVTLTEAGRLAVNAKMVLEKAISLGGTTIRSYTSSLGVTGRFQNELNVHMRKGETCYKCQTVIEKTRVGGRGTYFCPSCQK
jgi:formamidopyrimidine-DNA glycosylase